MHTHIYIIMLSFMSFFVVDVFKEATYTCRNTHTNAILQAFCLSDPVIDFNARESQDTCYLASLRCRHIPAQ